MRHKTLGYHPLHYFIAWAVHAFTASAACFGILTLIKIYQHDYIQALWFMAITVVIDALDGTFARLVRVKAVLPHIDGTLLDNIVDFLNYVITPCFFLYVKPDMLPASTLLIMVLAITITSTYQFSQIDAKTIDHFFKGFPCYWNIALFYMFIFNTSKHTNVLILSILCVLIFIPIKYVYPSRLDYLTRYRSLKMIMHLYSLVYGFSSALVLWNYPNISYLWLFLSLSYVIMYLMLSIYRTYFPITMMNN